MLKPNSLKAENENVVELQMDIKFLTKPVTVLIFLCDNILFLFVRSLLTNLTLFF